MVMEVETPVNKRDLVRLDDAYGRKAKGYEGKEFYIPFMDGYAHLPSFYEITSERERRKVGSCSVYLIPGVTKDFFMEEDIPEGALICVLRGLLRHEAQILGEIGDVISGDELKKRARGLIVDETDIFIITKL